MKLPPGSVAKAKTLQRRLRARIVLAHLKEKPKFIAGADAAFDGDFALAAACVFSFPALELLDIKTACVKVKFPYIPGLLAFREGPAVINVVKKLRPKPDVLLIDGQGIAHPERMGIASHVGLLLGIPTIGCAKSRLVGECGEPGKKAGSRVELVYKGETVGAVLRTKDNVRPMFISPGHLVDMEDAVSIVLECARGFRMPEPTRQADLITKKMKREGKQQCAG
ncbi:MAG: deoxyribonuclease V [Nitrospiraceae bacterium]|nr:deoxyribonuclease V [Nitrospiraceae bacterium]